MSTRDTFMVQPYWDDYLHWVSGSIQRFETLVAVHDAPLQAQQRWRTTLFDRHLEQLIALYSSGADLALIGHAYQGVVRAFEVYRSIYNYAPVNFEDFDTYLQSVWLVAIAILLNADQATIEQVVRLVNSTGKDAIFDRLASLYIDHQSIAPKLLYPRPYDLLNQALNEHGRRREVLIETFLNRYYRGMRQAYWYDRHMRPDAGFFGYWCFECAAFVKAIQISDQRFADNVYYPKDLVPRHGGHETRQYKIQ